MVQLKEWKGLIYNYVNYSERFEVSNKGKLRNSKTKLVYKLCKNKNGYMQICCSLGSRKNKIVFKIHRCVACTFIENPNKHPLPNHKDGNKTNNCVDNLEWCTQSENIIHAYKNGLVNSKKGEEHNSSKLTEEDVIFIRNNYKSRNRK